MASRNWVLVLAVLLTSAFTIRGLAAESGGKEPAAGGQTAPATAVKENDKASPVGAKSKSVADLIQQLDSADFDTREAATSELAAKGKEAVPSLEQAAEKGNLEVASRAISVLGKLAKASDTPTASAATDALERLSKSENPTAARKARAILTKKEAPRNQPDGMGGVVIPGGGRIIIGGGQLQLGPGMGGMKTMRVSNVNGVRDITATDGDKTIKIHDDPGQGIKIESTEKENGKEVTKKFEAKNVDELKKNHPAGYELYKQYGGEQQQGNMGAIQLQIQGNLMPLQPNALPGIPPQALPIVPQAVPANPQIEIATARLRALSAQLESLQKGDGFKDAPAEKKAELKKQIDELSRQLESLKRQLGDK